MCGCKKGGGPATVQHAVVQHADMGGVWFAHAPLSEEEIRSMSCPDDYVKIRYNGPVGNHYVYSPGKKVTSYGMHTSGDYFCVHVGDQQMAPRIFVPLEESAPPPAPPIAPALVPALTAEFTNEAGEVVLTGTAEIVEVAEPEPEEEEKPAPRSNKGKEKKHD